MASANTELSPLVRVVDEFAILVHETHEYHKREEVKSILREASRTLAAVRRRLQLVGNRYVVAAVGLSNVGKSTLLNALLGNELAPRRNGPCTAAPIEFVFGPALEVTAYYRKSLRRPRWKCDDIEAAHYRLAALAEDAGAEVARSIRKVVVEVPNPLLKDGLVIADTPGFGAAQLGDAQSTHESALTDYLRDEVSQVFWIVLAEQGIGKREKSFHDELFADACDDVVVTGSEDWSQTDRDRFRRRFAECFEQRLPTFHFVSGLEGVKARQTDDLERLESAGILALEGRIRQLAEPDGRLATMQSALLQLAGDISYWSREFGSRHAGDLRHWWRPDSWIRWREKVAVDAFAGRLTVCLEEQL